MEGSLAVICSESRMLEQGLLIRMEIGKWMTRTSRQRQVEMLMNDVLDLADEMQDKTRQ